MSDTVIIKLRSLVENLVQTHQRRVDRSDQDHLRKRLAEAIFLALGGQHAIKFDCWDGNPVQVPPRELAAQSGGLKSRVKGEIWSLEVVGSAALSREIIRGLKQTLEDAIRRLTEILPVPQRTEDEPAAAIAGIETASYAERILARLRRKFVESGLVSDAAQVLFGIYRSDWRAFHLDRDIVDQMARDKHRVRLDPEIKHIISDEEVWLTLNYWLKVLCDDHDAKGIKKLLERVLGGESELTDSEGITSLLKLWSVIPNPRENTMTWSVLSGGCPTIVWKPVSFNQNPLQKLVVAIESSIGLYVADKPFIVIPIEVFGQPRMVVYLMRVESPQEVLERTFWRSTWLGDIFSAFQTEFVARIQGQILAEPKADIWATVISSLPLFLNLKWSARVEGGEARAEVYSVEPEREFIYQLRRCESSEVSEEREKLLSEALNLPYAPAAIPLNDDSTLLVLPVKDSRLLVELEACHNKVAPHLHAIWHLVQESIQLAQRQQEQTRRLIAFSTHDLNLFMRDLSSWTDKVKELLLNDPPEPDLVDLRFASSVMVHVGWTPLQMWRDTIGFLLEGPSDLKANYDIAETLEWIHKAYRARANKTIEFVQRGVSESVGTIPNNVRPLFHIVVYNIAYNAIIRAKLHVTLDVRLSENGVEIVCINDASRGDAENLKKLNNGVELIKRGTVYAFERWARGSGILGWAMLAQNRLGAANWDFQSQVVTHPSDQSRIQTTITVKLKWGKAARQ